MKKLLWILMIVFGLSMLLAGCGGKTAEKEEGQTSADPAEPKGTIVVATKPFAEQYILGNMIVELLKAKTELDVDGSKIGMGPTQMLHPAMLNGDIDIYPEYSGTSLLSVLKQPLIADREEAYQTVKDAYAKEFNLAWLPALGFENNYAVVIRKETFDKIGAKTLSELAEHKDLVFVANPAFFDREDGYPGLQKLYGFDNKLVETDVMYQFDILMQEKADITPAFSTAGKLKEFDLVRMEDDKHLWPFYDCGFIVRQEILDKYPEIEDALKPLFGSISEEVMIDLNYQVDVEKKDPADVAKEYLTSKGLI